MFKLMKHSTMNGWGVSLVKYENGEVVNGFVLISFDEKADRDHYYDELQSITGFEDDEPLD